MFSQLISVGRLLSSNYFKPARVQRQYIWDLSECDRFHRDLLDAFETSAANDYYLGPIILAEDEVEELVWVYDGQQRLTTLTIYLAAIGQLTQGSVQHKSAGLSKTTYNREVRPRIDLRTQGGALLRVVNGTQAFRNNPKNMPVDWRIYNIEKRFIDRLREIKDLDAFAGWVQRHVILNVLWAEDNSGLILFDRANNRGVHLEWFELVKSVITDALGPDFSPEPRKKIDEVWYEAARETKHEFPDLIASTAFIRYGSMDSATALSNFEDEFDADREKEQLQSAGRDLFKKLGAYRKTSSRLQAIHERGARIETESDLIRLQLLFLEYPHWKSLLMHADEQGIRGEQELEFLQRLRRSAYTAHLIGWPAWPKRLDEMFGIALQKLRDGIRTGQGMNADLLKFNDEARAQARGVLSSSITESAAYRPLVKLWESEQAYRQGVLDGHAHFLCHVEHILPRAPRGDWCRAFPKENERAELINRLGNLCLLSRDDNYRVGNDEWAVKQNVYRASAACFVGARTAAAQVDWTPDIVSARTQEIADGIVKLLQL